MNKRVVSIINRIIKEKKVSIEALAAQHNVTNRTIRYDIDNVNTILKENGMSLLEYEENGFIVMKPDFHKIKDIINKNDFYFYKLSKEERVLFGSYFIVNSEFTLVNSISEKLCISRSTVIKDIPYIKKYLNMYALKLLSSNKGLYVEGTEENKRKLILEILNYVNHHLPYIVEIYRLLNIEIAQKVLIRECIDKSEKEYNQYLSDTYYNSLILYIDLMISRNLRGYYLPKCDCKKNSKHDFIRSVMSDLSKQCPIRDIESELCFALKIIGQPKYTRYSSYKKENILKAQIMTREFIEAVSEKLDIELMDDSTLFENLSNHVSSMMRVSFLLTPQKDMVEQIRLEYPEVLKSVNENIEIINACVGRKLSEMEIIYITIHICAKIEVKRNHIRSLRLNILVICDCGVGVLSLLVARINKFFDFHIIDTLSSRYLENVDLRNIDLIISTTEIQDMGVDTVLISKLLTDSDYLNISKSVDKIKVKKMQRKKKSRFQEYSKFQKYSIGNLKEGGKKKEKGEFLKISDILPKENMSFVENAKNWKEAVYKSGKILLDKGYIEENYINSIIGIIEENGPYMLISKGFALAHSSIDSGTLQLGMSMIRLKNGVEFGSELFDPVEFIFTLSAVDNTSHIQPMLALYNMLKDESICKELKLAQNVGQVMKIIKEYE